MNRVDFHRPVVVGDTVSFWSEVVSLGRTSITMRIRVATEREGHPVELTHAEVTYVAVDLSGQMPRPIPIRD